MLIEPSPSPIFHCKAFASLSPEELYSILTLRNEVFVVDQKTIYVDTDGKDLIAHHLWATIDHTIVAYCRLIPPGGMYPQMSIGRVVAALSHRKKQYGRLLLQTSIKKIYELFGRQEIKISAQQYLEKFYASFGFITISEMYYEDGIPHVAMILPQP